MKSKYIIGCDPGSNGGIAVIDIERHEVVEVVKMPSTPQDVLDFLTPYNSGSVCYLEKVQGMPGQGGGAMFTFGRGFGQLEMAFLALKIPTKEVRPQLWQKCYQLGSSSKHTKTEWKNILKAKAQQMFPHIKVTLALADALLIAEYGYLQEK